MNGPTFPFGDWGTDLSPRYAELCTDPEPAHQVTTVTGDRMWLVTRHELARKILTDPLVSATAALAPDAPRQEPVPQRGPDGTNDALTALREAGLHRLLADALGAGSVRRHRDWTRRQAGAMVAELTGPGGCADLVTGLVRPLPFAMLCRVLVGPLDDADRDLLNEWGDVMLSWGPPFGEHTHDELTAAGGKAYTFFLERLPELAAAPGPHLLGRVARAGALPPADLAVVAMMLFIAGYRTTSAFLGNALVTLLRRPDVMRAVREDPGVTGLVVEELLRHTPMATGGVKRLAVADVEVGGMTIGRGQGILVALEGANHDPRVFADPDAFDPTRPERQHVAFGFGKHYCPGNQLARMQITAAVRAVAEHTPELRPAVPAEELTWQRAAAFRRLRSLPVTW
ncbi:cytochrome P450 [Nonomuraea longicatena]|uniref:Cytochrome P450 n=1 Tax=Nonomuraea longicatena TaxID=83682 RepID=A0ABN1R5H7_9ACTN